MKKRWISAALSAALALCGSGCNAPVTDTRKTDGAETGQTSLREVVDTQQQGYPFSPEYPSAQMTALDGTPKVELMSTSPEESQSGEIRAVWISYLEMKDLLYQKTEAQFTANIDTAFDNIKNYGLNTVIVHVRPFGDALYQSDYYPWSHVITGTEGKDPGFDPLQIMVDAAKAKGLRIEAWLNPYRVRANGNNNALSADNYASKWIQEGSGAVIRYDGTISYNPASESARNLIVKGAAEIVRKYDIDGIHIDDYFYPSSDTAYDKNSYAAYQKGGGTLGLADWRRSNVEKLIKQMYEAIKAEDKTVLFGISPQSNVQTNYQIQYLDVEKIAGTTGYCDYICPQIYFGYENAVQPYAKTLQQWHKIVENSDVKLYVGLAAYKVGGADSWAGTGRNEWINNTDLMKRMVSDARSGTGYAGFVLYRYDYIFNPPAAVKQSMQAENKNLRSIL